MAERVKLHVMQKIQVSRDGETWYNASIQNVTANLVYITIPYRRESPLLLRRGDTVQVRFFKEDSSYHFETQVIGETKEKIELYRIGHPEHITRVQQRMHVRMPVILDTEYALAEEQVEKEKSPSFTRATAVDLSGGGMKLALRRRIPENTMLLLRFTLPLQSKPEKLELEARVIRCVRVDQKRDLYHLGLKFENINHRQQDIIVRFIFQKMSLCKRMQ